MRRVSADEIPLVDGRCSAQGWCLVEENKDCRPTKWSWPAKPCDHLNATAAQKELYAQRFKTRAELRGAALVKGISLNEA